MALTENHNVYSTAVRAIELSGWKISVEMRSQQSSKPYQWIAKNSLEVLYANNPIELLGLVKIYEINNPSSFEPYWWEIEGDRCWTSYLPDRGASL